MFKFLFNVVKKIVFASVLIYSFDFFSSSLNIIIPINFLTIILVSLFDFSALVCLMLFSIVI